MGMDQYLSGVVAFPGTTYDEKTDSRIIAPDHQKLRDLCKITAPFHIGGGPLIFFPLMHWKNEETIHEWFLDTSDGVYNSGDKFWVSFSDIQRFLSDGSFSAENTQHLASIIAYQNNPKYQPFDGFYYEADW